MTTTDPNPGDQRRGRHAKREDVDRTADEAGAEREPAHAADDDAPADDAHHGATRAEEGDPEPDDGPGPPADDDEHADAPAAGGPTADAGRDEQAPEAEQRPAGRPGRRAPAPEAPPEPARKRSTHALAHHPAGSALLTAAGLVTGLSLVPLLFDALRFEVAIRAGAAARSAAAPWPAGGEPWFWPGWVATLATVVAVVVLVVAAVGLRLPDIAVLAAAVVLAVTTARAAWATIDVLNAHLWELVPVCIVCLVAFGAAATAAFRWRSGESTASGAGTGEVAGVTLGAWLVVVLLVLGGSAIASSAQTHAFGNVTSPPQDVAGLLSVRSADSPELAHLRGSWVPQLGAAQVKDDAGATAYAVVHHGFTTRYRTLLVRGDDVGAPGLDATSWLSLADQPFGSADEAAGWCSASGVPGCTPLMVSG